MIRNGAILGKRYEVAERVGTGGMADVYRGYDHKLQRAVAIKALKSEYSEDASFVRKFQSEAQAAAGLMHANIVNVYDVGEQSGLYYMVMELVEGITLKEYIEKKRRLPAREVISIALQVCMGIQMAHQNHIIHRDIKPQNIMISKDGKVKVTDFGIARAASSTSTNTISTNAMGSVHYTSPEQARGGFSDEKSDIYSLGITMYEMLTGRLPFDGETVVSVAIKHLQEELVKPSAYVQGIPRSLEDIVLKCTQKGAEKRYTNIELLMIDLKKSLANPDGNFVALTAVSGGAQTIMLSKEELDKLKARGAQYAEGSSGRYRDDEYEYDDDDYEDEYDDDEYDDDEYDDDDYEDEYDDDDYDDDFRTRSRRTSNKKNADPSTERVIKILKIAAIAVVILVVFLIIGQATGLLRKGSGTEDEQITEVKVDVPNIIGLSLEEAERELEKLGLKLGRTSGMQMSLEYEEGLIIEQDPKEGEEVEEGTEVNIVISAGKEVEEVQVPEVKNLQEEEAKAKLIGVGFSEANITVMSRADAEVESGRAIGTDPAANTMHSADTKITLVISMGPERVQVPSITGKTKEEAEAALTTIGLTLSVQSEEWSNTVPSGTVISQNINVGQEVDPGRAVGVVISKGVEQVQVPNILNNTRASAESTLIQSGLVMQIAVQRVHSDTVVEGSVLDFEPGAGVMVDRGTIVTVTLSAGPKPPEPPANVPDDSENEGDSGD